MRYRPGLALILVVGVLGILAVLGATFAVLSRLERRAASQRVQATQAFLLARSGLEDAQARLDAGQDPAYGGEDWDSSKTLDGLEVASEVYRLGALDVEACPVRQALRPSFFVTSTTDLGTGLKPAPMRILVEGRQRGYSGSLASGTWAIKAHSGGGFHVNGGNPAVLSNPASTSDFNTTLRRMFGVLAEAIDREDGSADNSPVGKADGENLIKRRPTTGWMSFEQIRDGAFSTDPPAVRQAKLDALKNYLVLSAWTDKKVIGCNIDRRSGERIAPAAAPFNGGFHLKSLLRMGNWNTSVTGLTVGETRGCPDLESLPRFNYLKGIDAGPVCGRAPVDLAWARTKRPALLALLADLKGFYWQDEWQRELNQNRSSFEPIGALKPASIALDWTAPADDCRRVADALMTTTSELKTWEQWNAFCDSLSLTGDSGLRQGKKDLLKANFNPNTDANKFNPTEAMARTLDKSDILVESTELRLGSSPRSWKISSCGRTREKPAATRVLSAETAPDRLCTLTTQAEFVAGNLGDPDRAGDESAFRACGDPTFLTTSVGLNVTWGHTLPNAASHGFGLQTYPETPPEWSSGTYGAPPLWDGQLKLASLETADKEYAQTGKMMFLARWDDDWNADYSGGGGDLSSVDPPEYQGVPGDSIWPDLRLQIPYPANLFPDGAYLEFHWIGISPPWMWNGSCPTYWAPGNMAPSQGTISYWFKPAVDTSTCVQEPPCCLHFCNTRWKKILVPPGFPPDSGTMWDSCAFLNIWGGGLGTLLPSAWVPDTARAFSCFWDNPFRYTKSDDPFDEQGRSTPVREVRSHWYLMTCFWDMVTPRTGGPDAGRSCRLLVDRGLADADQNTAWSYADQFNKDIHSSEAPLDYTFQEPGCFVYTSPFLGPMMEAQATFTLGNSAQSSASSNRGPYMTMDEFAIYDLGLATGGAGDGKNLSEELARQRYTDGRYYKESTYLGLGNPANTAGQWFSAPLDLGDVRIRSLSWTQIVPRGLKRLSPIPAGTPLEDYDDGDEGRIIFDLVDAAGTAYALDHLFTDPRGERIGNRLRAPFRLHAIFQPNLEAPLDKAILDPLVLDDVTVTYRSLSRPAMTAFQEGE